jgi:hypothetical protein
MKIGFDAKRAFHNYTGLGNYSRTIVRNISRIYPGHTYFLFTPEITNKFDSFPPAGMPVIEPEKGLDRMMRSYWRSFRMGTDIYKHKIDIFHGLSNELPRNIKRSRAKSVVTIHDLIFLRFPQFYTRIDRLFIKIKFLPLLKWLIRLSP